jgi:enoyl-CoA hydratase/carnithine racemase
MTSNNALQHVTLSVRAGVAHLVLNRPDRRNVLGLGEGSSRDEIVLALQVADADPNVRCVLITAAGASFCGGGDLSDPALQSLTPDALVAGVDKFNAGVRDVAVPVVAAVQGHCLGAGMAFIAQCDFVLAADDAVFGLPEGRFGDPAGAALADVIGPAMAKFLAFTGERLSAEQARECGLVLFTLPPDQLQDRATALAEQIARMPAEALALNKRAIDAATEAGGRGAGRLAGRARDVVTRSRSASATAPDGRRFSDILRTEGVAGIKEATRQQSPRPWLSSHNERTGESS